MNILIMMMPITFLIAGGFVAAFIWSTSSGQYDDTTTPAHRILFDDNENEGEKNDDEPSTI